MERRSTERNFLMRRPYLTLGLVLRWLGVTVLLGLFVWYIAWQSWVFITGPALTITTTPPPVTNHNTVEIAGRAENIVWIRVNDRDIVTTPTGDFKERVPIGSGYTILKVAAADRFGRTVTKLYPIVATPTPAQSAPNH